MISNNISQIQCFNVSMTSFSSDKKLKLSGLRKDNKLNMIGDLVSNFSILKKCNGKLVFLIYELLFIRKKKPILNMQLNSICAKLFV